MREINKRRYFFPFSHVFIVKEDEVHRDGTGDTKCSHRIQRYALPYGALSHPAPKVCIDELKDSLAAPEQKETLKELLDLPVRQKTVLYLHYVEGYRIKEIADILGTTEGAVKMRLRRGRKQMQLSRSMRAGHFRKSKSSRWIRKTTCRKARSAMPGIRGIFICRTGR